MDVCARLVRQAEVLRLPAVPKCPITGAASSPCRQLRVARATVKLRLDKLQQRGIIRGFDPDLDLRAMGKCWPS
jgi:hypothetical protein